MDRKPPALLMFVIYSFIQKGTESVTDTVFLSVYLTSRISYIIFSCEGVSNKLFCVCLLIVLKVKKRPSPR